MSFIDDPLSIFTGAIETIIGWSFAYVLTWLIGLYIGSCVGSGQFENALWVLFAIPLMLLVLVFENPYFVLSFVAFFVFWGLPLWLDTSRARVAFLALALGAATFSGYALTTVEIG